MSYIGSTPTTQSFIAGTDYFNGDGSTVAFTLSRSVVSVNDIEVVINNVEQQPNSAYTVSGTTITFTSAPSAGTSNIYVRYLSTTTQSITPSQNTVSYSTLNSDNQSKLGISFKNRLINPAMVIDQRNAGASVTITTANEYTLDRWGTYASQSNKFTVQQNAGSVTPPAGFTNYLGVTSSAATSLGAGDYYILRQDIEGFNTADLNWGTANAKTVTLSFWVRSSLTGTFSVCLTNVTDGWYTTTYTINAANTWEQKTITIAGPAIGTWLTTNGIGIEVRFNLGIGSTYTGAANTWTSSVISNATGSTNFVGTSGATWYVTGVQLEVGTQATTFDYRSYGTEFDLCRRYYEKFNYSGSSSNYITSGSGMAWTGTDVRTTFSYYTKRTAPTCAFSGTIRFATAAYGQNFTSMTFDGAGVNTALIFNGSASGFTAGQAQQATSQADNTYISISAEL